MEIRNRLYDLGIFRIHRLPVSIISIGNLTVGGTGKTPLTIEIARGLLERDPLLSVGVISRGYRRAGRDGWIVSDGKNILMKVGKSGDEPQLMAKQLRGIKILVGSDRVKIAKRAIAHYPLDVLILDDAFQHRRIHRDVDILLVDGEKGLGSGRVLPSGPLREFAWNLKRATCLVVTHYRDRIPLEISRYVPPGTQVFKTRLTVSGIMDGISGKEVPLEDIRGKKVWGVCGIAYPESFLETLEELGVKIAGFTPLPDHHAYSREDLKDIARQAGNGRVIITTWKDWVKWEGNHSFERVYVVSVRAEFLDREDDFYDFIQKFVYNRKNEM